MYDSSDPRSVLSDTSDHAATSDAAVISRFYDVPPQYAEDSADYWYVRGQNFITVYIEARGGLVFSRKGQIDEYAVLIPDAGTMVEVRSLDSVERVSGGSILFVPPGDSALTVLSPGRLIVLVTALSKDLCERCANNSAFALQNARIPLFRPGPGPADGFRVRRYSLDVPDVPGRFGRIWSCSTFMINVFPEQIGPRDTTKLSPHQHGTFEQGSLVLEGTYMHHLRWAWTKDLSAWREDAHELCNSPSLAIIPPGVIHTSRAVAPGVNRLVDIFSPPRLDFSQQEGWVLNQKDYPAIQA